MTDIVDVLTLIFGVIVITFTLFSAVRAFVLPRGERDRLTIVIFAVSRFIFGLRVRKARTYNERDRIMALFAPVTLLCVPLVWVILLIIGYACVYWAIGVKPWPQAIEISGSTLLTLGTVPFINLHTTIIQFSQATLGLGIVALLLAYLPAMYSAFSQREALVTMLEIRAGSPSSATEFILRMHRNKGLDVNYLSSMWLEWEVWFTQLEESHTSLAPLVYFRSPHPARSWVTAAGTILDAASLVDSTIDMPLDFHRRIMIRAGFLSLRRIADVFQLQYDADPKPDDAISIGRDEFDEVYNTLKEAGVPVKPDQAQAWRDFQGWRVNYDRVLLRLAAMTLAPYAPWVSDRSVPRRVRRNGLIRAISRESAT